MKNCCIIFLFLGLGLFNPFQRSCAQGTSCSNANSLTLDGVCRTFASSSVTGSSIFCTTSGYSGNNGRITYFQFTTNGTSDCVLIDVTTTTAVTMEMVLYNGCSGGLGTPSGGLYQHGMCMTDGKGLWAQNLFNSLTPNTTYYLRVRTQGGYTGDLQVCARYYTPVNDECIGATAIDSIPKWDNNACHTPNYSVPAAQLCAITLENTAWYTFVVEKDGSSIITIDSIECDNGDGNNNNGFQIGFFTGDCNTLLPYSCTNGAGGTVLAPAINLLAGTRIYVGVDGYSGSNCRYTINATNAIILPVVLKNFVVWQAPQKNIIKWITEGESAFDRFEIQRSEDGRDFLTIGVIGATESSNLEKHYSFEDHTPLAKAFYRLKMIDDNGKFSYSRIIEAKRNLYSDINILPVAPAADQLKLNIESGERRSMLMNIVDVSGRILLTYRIECNKGLTVIEKDISRFSKGVYTVLLRDEQLMTSRSFIKTGPR